MLETATNPQSGKPETEETKTMIKIVSEPSDIKTESESAQKKKRPRSDGQKQVFQVAIVFAMIIVVPYAWYAVRINSYAQ